MTTNLLSRTPLLPSFFPAHARNLQRNCALTWIRTADLSNFERLKFPTFPFLSFFFLVLFCFPTKFQGSFPCNLPPCPSFSSFKVRMALGREKPVRQSEGKMEKKDNDYAHFANMRIGSIFLFIFSKHTQKFPRIESRQRKN